MIGTRFSSLLLAAFVHFPAGTGASPAELATVLELANPVLDIEILGEAGRVAWSSQGDEIAFDRADLARGGLYDLFVLDVSTGTERCLTCRNYDFRSAHAINPSWHPSGDYLVFQVQANAKKLRTKRQDLITPSRGLFGDLWLVRADGKATWQLTRVTERGSAVLDPHFSNEGGRVQWSERTVSRKGPWGLWQLRTAELRIRRGTPSLRSIAGHRPLEIRGLVVAEGFMPDDRRLLLSGARRPGAARDIGIWDPEKSTFEALTASASGDDEHPRISPRGDLLVWVADAARRGNGPRLEDVDLPAREVWMMTLDGSARRPLTRFNEPDAAEGLGRTWVGDLAWSPAGDRLAVQVIHGAQAEEQVVILQLDAAFRR